MRFLSRDRLGHLNSPTLQAATCGSRLGKPLSLLPPIEMFMSADLTEEEMRRALFGTAQPEHQLPAAPVQEPVPDVVFTKPVVAPAAKKKMAKAFTPRLKVTLRVGNEFEGKMYELIHEADTLSSLLAEQEAVKTARKKYRYVEVVSVKSM